MNYGVKLFERTTSKGEWICDPFDVSDERLRADINYAYKVANHMKLLYPKFDYIVMEKE